MPQSGSIASGRRNRLPHDAAVALIESWLCLDLGFYLHFNLFQGM